MDPSPNPRLPEDIDYEILVLRKMLEQLPGRAGELIQAQVAKVMAAVEARFAAVHARLVAAVDDAILSTKLRDFDLEVTKKEKAVLQDRLDQI